jgi:D-beta-D-heptose 7-phosphate kinase/D-beta-D-heptose 1-phosphate adenosyltransferase
MDEDRAKMLIRKFADLHVFVLGDYYLDEYVQCQMLGISPEMPVPRMLEVSRLYAPGAAGNVAANFAALGAKVSAFGILGNDAYGERLKTELQRSAVDTSYLLTDHDRITGTFSRVTVPQVRGTPHHYLRIDRENSSLPSSARIGELTEQLVSNAGKASVIFVADYDETATGCGLISKDLLDSVRNAACRCGALLCGISRRHLGLFKGFDCVLCNRTEAMEMGYSGDLENIGLSVLRDLEVGSFCITLAEEGAILFSSKAVVESKSVPSKLVDPCGAGDCFAAVTALSLCTGAPPDEALDLANYAASLAVRKSGTAAISASELLNELRSVDGTADTKLVIPSELAPLLNQMRAEKKIVFTNGYFDILHSGHIRFLREARRFGDLLVVGINSDRSTYMNKGDGRPVLCEADRIELLTSLECVDYVTVFDELTPINLIRQLQPDVLVKGGNYRVDEVVGKDIVESYHGKIFVVPYQGSVTTRTLIQSIKTASDGTRPK